MVGVPLNLHDRAYRCEFPAPKAHERATWCLCFVDLAGDCDRRWIKWGANQVFSRDNVFKLKLRLFKATFLADHPEIIYTIVK